MQRSRILLWGVFLCAGFSGGIVAALCKPLGPSISIGCGMGAGLTFFVVATLLLTKLGY
jgi:hypothetical protein